MGSKGLNKPLLLWRMGISFYQRCLFSLVLMGWGQFVFAEDYYWMKPTSTERFSSPSAACTSWATIDQKSLLEYAGSNGNSPRAYEYKYSAGHLCRIYTISNNGSVISAYMRRFGSGCTLPAILNPATRECEAPPPEPDKCEAKKGQETTASTVYPDVKYEFCISQCVAAVTGVKASSTPNAFGPTYIYYNAEFSGESCTQDTPGPDVPPEAPPPTESEKDEDCGPTEVVYDGEGRRHEISNCVTEEKTRDNQKCVAEGGSVGSINGVMECIKKEHGPSTTENKKDVKKETETAPDGSKKETTTTTTTTTTCNGGRCTSTTRVETKTEHTKSDGTNGGSSSTCKGDKCPGTGSGGGSGGSGSGSGNGSGDSDSEGEEENEGPKGPNGTLKQGKPGDFSEGITEWDQRISDVRGELDRKLNEYSGLFKGVFDLDLGTGGGSLPCDNIPISFGTTSTTLRFCLADYSDPLSYLRYALLLGAAALAAVIILRG